MTTSQDYLYNTGLSPCAAKYPQFRTKGVQNLFASDLKSWYSQVDSLFWEEMKKVGLSQLAYLLTLPHVGLVHDITDTDCWAQDGSIKGPEMEWKN